MTPNYSNISLTHMQTYLGLLGKCKTRASDYSFANIWGWAPYYNLEWRFEDDLCWIRQTQHGQCFYWAPVGDWSKVTDWKKYPEFASGNTFIRVPQELKNMWQQSLGDKINIAEARGQWDYLYSGQELYELSGNRFHKKKNLLRQFQKMYNYEYRSLSANCAETVLNMQVEWCRWRDCEASEALLAENDAVARVLANWNEIPGLCGGIIRIDGVPVAYTIAEPIADDTLVIHFEKAATGIKGAYQAINWLFIEDVGQKYAFVNREQDLDDEGLRKAKESYNPVGYTEKYTVSVL